MLVVIAFVNFSLCANPWVTTASERNAKNIFFMMIGFYFFIVFFISLFAKMLYG
jgi:hypothetical protein